MYMSGERVGFRTTLRVEHEGDRAAMGDHRG